MLGQTSQIIAYENGELDEDETVTLFQALIDSGLAWQLQGHYGRTAHALIEAGTCTPPQPIPREHPVQGLVRNAEHGEG